MMKTFRLSIIAMLTNIALNANSQTVVYSEDFDGPLTWTLNTDPIAEDAFPNQWYISCQEEGVGTGNCGTACSGGNQTLHVSGNIGLTGDLGAAYAETGAAFTGANRRAESADISTVGFTNLTLSFHMIGFGGNAQDYAELFYSTNSGATWTSIATPLTAACCGGPCSGLEQGLWQTNTYVLPAACENIATLRISFVWRNVDDGVATDPSFAVDNIEITTPSGPVASFTTPITTICVGDCIDFTNTSTGGPFTATDWTFTGAAPATSSANNPTGICYNTAGTYAVSLSVTDGSAATDVETIAGYITVVDAPDAGADASSNLCNNTTLNLNTLLSGADPGGTWAETSGTPSGQFTAGTGVLDGNGLTAGSTYTFTYTVTGAPCPGSDVSTFTINIVDCSPGVLTASFTPSRTDLCPGECITFVEASLGVGIIGWTWTFPGGTPGSASTQNPGSVCFNTPGSYNLNLSVTDGTVTDDTTITITVHPLPTITASASPASTVCNGDPVTLTGAGATSYTWTGGVTDGVAFTPAISGNYTVTGTDTYGCENTASIFINVITCVPMIAGFSYPDNICLNDCITLTDTTTGNPTSWSWDFGGGATPNTSTDQNPVVCFDGVGTFDIQLTTTDASGDNSSVTNTISVFGVPTVTAEKDTVVDIGNEIPLEALGSGTGSYWWVSTDGEVSCDTCAVTIGESLVNTEFIVTFTDINGCKAVDTVYVLVNFIEGIGVPEAFSPNGDSNNDVLFVKGYGIELMNFSVYNRYGQKVFETTDQNIGWDGTFKGRDENPGVFVWVLEYTFITGQGGVISGNTTLIR